MATINTIKLSQLEGAKRIDAEFYQPEYIIDFSKGKWIPIKKILEICQYGISQAMIEEPAGYPIFRMDDIKDGFLVDDEVKYIQISKNTFEQFKLEINDILFNRVNAEEFVGRTGIFKLKGNFVFASYLIRIRTKRNSQILPDYLNIFLNCKFGKKQIKRFSRRAVNQANVNAEEVKNFKIPLFSIDFQKKIATLSNEAWENIQLSKTLYQQAESILLQELGLQDFKPQYHLSYTTTFSNTFNTHRIDAEYFQPIYEEVINRIKSYKNGFDKLLNCVENVKADFNPYRLPNKVFSYVELADINTSVGTIENSKQIKGDEAPSRARRIIKQGDVIVSRVEGSLEKVALVSKDFENSLASTGFFQFRPFKISPQVLLVLAKSLILQIQFKRECAGTILTAIPEKALTRFIIPILPDDIQQKISSLVQQSHQARQKAKQLLEEAKRTVEKEIEELSS